ncbi:hypothetical protein HQ39_03935 [Porphyromonas sp. COT-108 OH2963]|uniref:Uncharacterized protein n=1 Tax=Porphyromonas canoris TaxID=36875 RepID=A0ABR4XK37_9PORP|nr:hypothetical protein JT26_03400 [Porphyromonas sp. COT-108 OH1349]KGN92037.1 hypothetical protein HQ43_08310 [Porphyromonas canoris]KGN96108.1 hypothetical protein HQ39_03935 [Porphyromonas sp. COT-108 OH2963]
MGWFYNLLIWCVLSSFFFFLIGEERRREGKGEPDFPDSDLYKNFALNGIFSFSFSEDTIMERGFFLYLRHCLPIRRFFEIKSIKEEEDPQTTSSQQGVLL